MNNMLKNLTDTQKGLILIVSGLILLFFLMGFLKEALHYVILITSLFLIGYGVILGDFWTKISKMIKRHKNKE